MIEGPKIKWSTDRLIANKNEKKKIFTTELDLSS